MIPRICANCAHASIVSAEREGGPAIAGAVCRALPLALWKDAGESCGSFSMAQEPPVHVDEAQEPPARVEGGETDGQ